MQFTKVRRRHVMASAGAFALAMSLAPAALGQDKPFAGTKLTYWGGLIFSEEANKLLVDEINAWGAANGVETEVVMINQNETVQKVSAAVEAGTLPDALDVSLDLLLLLSAQDVFLTLDDVYARIDAANGGFF